MDKILLELKKNSYSNSLNLRQEYLLDKSSSSMTIMESDLDVFLDKSIELIGNVESLVLEFEKIKFTFFIKDKQLLITKKQKSKLLFDISKLTITDYILLLNTLSDFDKKFSVFDSLVILIDGFGVLADKVFDFTLKNVKKTDYGDGDVYNDTINILESYVDSLFKEPKLESLKPSMEQIEIFKTNMENYNFILKITNTDGIKYPIKSNILCVFKNQINELFKDFLNSDKIRKLEYIQDYNTDNIDVEKVYESYSSYRFESFKSAINDLFCKIDDIRYYLKK